MGRGGCRAARIRREVSASWSGGRDARVTDPDGTVHEKVMNHQAYLPHAESPFVWGMGMIFLGFDPGGVFGVSVLRLPAHGPATAVVGSVRSVDDAVDWAVRQCRDETPRRQGSILSCAGQLRGVDGVRWM